MLIIKVHVSFKSVLGLQMLPLGRYPSWGYFFLDVYRLKFGLVEKKHKFRQQTRSIDLFAVLDSSYHKICENMFPEKHLKNTIQYFFVLTRIFYQIPNNYVLFYVKIPYLHIQIRPSINQFKQISRLRCFCQCHVKVQKVICMILACKHYFLV